ncbi:MAG: RdgB/HAM1 family non-canonical purine NTP pyrophosphatase [Verrucomicrobiota bacterium]|nr:RdgB/HAM1 family non-canonical purine NTP pyrophosphatase [Verrucomicrobiota bacterium]
MKIVIATGNAHKLGEISDIIHGFLPMIEILSLSEVPAVPEVIEDAGTIEGNAIKKAVEISNALMEAAYSYDFVLADDTGLEVDALDGCPGVLSARYAADETKPGENVSERNNQKLLRELSLARAAGKPSTARFKCVIALARSGALVQTFEGLCPGHIIEEQKGKAGFGYDPLFIPNGHDQTFSELGQEVKNRISHRGLALAQLVKYLKR